MRDTYASRANVPPPPDQGALFREVKDTSRGSCLKCIGSVLSNRFILALRREPAERIRPKETDEASSSHSRGTIGHSRTVSKLQYIRALRGEIENRNAGTNLRAQSPRDVYPAFVAVMHHHDIYAAHANAFIVSGAAMIADRSRTQFVLKYEFTFSHNSS